MVLTGINYLWTNVVSLRPYVGQTRSGVGNKFTSDANELLDHRFKQHCNDSKNGSDTYFHRALKKYGPDQFAPTILSIHTAETEEELVKILDEEEIKNICQLDTFNNGYNLTTGGSSPVFHETTRKKMSVQKQAFLATEEGKLWIDSVRYHKRMFYATEKGRQIAVAHGVHITAKYKAEPELINRIRESVLLYNDSPQGQEQRSRHSAWMIAYFDTPDGAIFRKHLSLCAKQRWANPEYRKAHVENGKRRFQGEEGIKLKQVLSEKSVERMKDPIKRKLASDKTKAHFDAIGRKEYMCDLCDKKCRDKTAYAKHCSTKLHAALSCGLSKEAARDQVQRATAEKISEGNKLWAKTHENARKGQKHTIESKEKNRIAHVGKSLSEAARLKLSETIKHQYELGERKSGRAKLTDDQVIYIRKNMAIIKQKELSAQFNVSTQTISAIQRNLVYKHITVPVADTPDIIVHVKNDG